MYKEQVLIISVRSIYVDTFCVFSRKTFTGENNCRKEINSRLRSCSGGEDNEKLDVLYTTRRSITEE